MGKERFIESVGKRIKEAKDAAKNKPLVAAGLGCFALSGGLALSVLGLQVASGEPKLIPSTIASTVLGIDSVSLVLIPLLQKPKETTRKSSQQSHQE